MLSTKETDGQHNAVRQQQGEDLEHSNCGAMCKASCRTAAEHC